MIVIYLLNFLTKVFASEVKLRGFKTYLVYLVSCCPEMKAMEQFLVLRTSPPFSSSSLELEV